MTLLYALSFASALGASDASPEPSAPLAALSNVPANGVSAAVKSGCSTAIKLNSKSKTLQRNLENRLAQSRLNRHTKKHRLSVSVVDLSAQDQTFYAGVNDDEMMYAASLPKIAILLTAAQQASDGKIHWTEEFDTRLASMITESSNPNASWGAEQVGLKAIEEVMRDPRYCFYDEKNGGLWVGRGYGGSEEENRDPLQNLSHAATARQAARFMTMLSRGQLVNKEWSDRMLSLMGPPKHHHKFVGGLQKETDVTFLARKSGTWRNFHSDVALIRHGEHLYVAAALSELKNGEAVMQEVIKIIDELVTEGKHRKGGKRSS